MARINITNRWNEIETIEADLLGRGAFATCYRHNDTVYSYVKDTNRGFEYNDYSKEAISNFTIESVHIPSIVAHGEVYTRGGFKQLYEMPFYNKLQKIESPVAYKQARILQKAQERLDTQFYFLHHNGYEYNNELIESVRDLLPSELIQALESINSACSSYGENYKFEFPTRNLKVDSNNNLVLLDCIFNVDALK